MLCFVDPFQGYYWLFLRSWYYFPYIILYDGLVFLNHGIYPFVLLCCLFKACRFFVNEITHQSHIIGVWLWLLSFFDGSYWNTMSFCFFGYFMSPSRFSLSWYHFTGKSFRCLRFCHIMVLKHLIFFFIPNWFSTFLQLWDFHKD